jgi:hypothetical protein
VGQNYRVGKTANNYRKRLEAFYEGPGQAFKAKIRAVVEAALHVDRHIDMKTLIVAFGFFAKSDNYVPLFFKAPKRLTRDGSTVSCRTFSVSITVIFSS